MPACRTRSLDKDLETFWKQKTERMGASASARDLDSVPKRARVSRRPAIWKLFVRFPGVDRFLARLHFGEEPLNGLLCFRISPAIAPTMKVHSLELRKSLDRAPIQFLADLRALATARQTIPNDLITFAALAPAPLMCLLTAGAGRCLLS